MKLRTLLQGAGIAALILFPFYRSMLDLPNDLRMHSTEPFTSVALSLIANLAVVALTLALGATWLQRTSQWGWLRLILPALVFASLAEVLHIAHGGWESTRLWIVVLLSALCLSLVLRWRWRRGEAILLQTSGATLMGIGLFSIFVVVRLLQFAVWRPLSNSTREAMPATNHVDRPRIVWIVFDELSYRQTFGSRFPDLQLPNFDALRKSSTLFTNTEPVVNETEEAIPSILLGRKITRVDYTTGNRLEVAGPTGSLHPFDAARTPFALARQRGLTTGVVGWYNPYCGMLTPYLDDCYWTHELQIPPVPIQQKFWKDFSFPWSLYAAPFRHPIQMLSPNHRAHAIEHIMVPGSNVYMGSRIVIYREVMRHAEGILAPTGPDFVFLHLPIPHPPGLYNRKTGELDASGKRSYIDNLALADKTLGDLMTILKQSPRWNRTAIVLCGDHSWRVYMWTRQLYWTAEGEAASHGETFDPRPVLMVHLPGQTLQETVTTPFSLLRVHDILNALIEARQPAYTSSPEVESSSGQ